MNTLNGYSKSTLSDEYLLKAGGGHITVGNANGNVPLSNETVCTNLNADLLDDKHASSFIQISNTTKSTVNGINNIPTLFNVENETLISEYGQYWYVFNMGSYSKGNFRTQIAMPYWSSLTDSELFIRSATKTEWRDWRRVLHSGNSYIKEGTITLNGNSITPLTSVSWGDILNKPTLSTQTALFNKLDYQYFVVLLCKKGVNKTGYPARLTGKLYTNQTGVTRYQGADVDFYYSNWSSGQEGKYYLDTYGLGTPWKIVTLTYNGEQWYALQHTSGQAINAYFLGTSYRIDFTSIHYYTSNTSTIINSEIYNSIQEVTYSLKTVRADITGTASKVSCIESLEDKTRPIVLTDTSNSLYYTSKATINYSTGNITAPTFTGVLKGNADTSTSAEKLTTVSKTAWGQTYWTSGGVPTSISGNMTGVGNITIAATDNKDYFINFLYNSTPAYSWRLGYLGSGSGNANYFVIDSSKSTGGTWHRVLQLGNETLEAVFTSNVTASDYIATSGIYKSSTTLYLDTGASDKSIVLRINGSEKARFAQPNGYLGILTSSPTMPLHVNGASLIVSDIAGILTLKRTSSSGGAFIDFYNNNQSSNFWRVGMTSSGDFGFAWGTTLTNTCVKSNGHFGVLTTSATYPLTVNGVASATRFIASGTNQYKDAGGFVMNNSDIWGLNAIYTADLANGASEGYQFKRTDGNYDSIWCADGTFYFSPNGLDTYNTNHTVLHSGNYTSYLGYIGTTAVQSSGDTQNLTGINYINGAVIISALNTDMARIWGIGHNLEFGGPGYAHRSYYFRPSYSSSGSTETNVYIQNASASDSPTFTTTHSFTKDGNASHLGTVTTKYGSNGKYLKVGPQNNSHAHYETDAGSHYFNKRVDVNGVLAPYSNNSFTCGASSARWSTVYSVSGNFSGTVNIDKLLVSISSTDADKYATDSAYYNLAVGPKDDSGGASILMYRPNDTKQSYIVWSTTASDHAGIGIRANTSDITIFNDKGFLVSKTSMELWSSGGSWNEGIRIHAASNGWSGIVFCDSSNTEQSGTSTNTWGIHNNEGTFYINKNQSSGATNSRVMGTSTGWTFGNTSKNWYALNTASFICDSWIRTCGDTGWYNETYGGGIYMTDTSWIRTYNGKSFYCDHTIYAGGVLQTASHTFLRFIQYTHEDVMGFGWDSSYSDYVWFKIPGTNNQSIHMRLAFSGGLYIWGSSYAYHFYEHSDIRYKNVLEDINISVSELATLPLFNFEWTDRDNGVHSGSSAQSVQKLLPNLVSADGEKLTLDYGVLGTIAGITACRELTKHEQEIQNLQNKIKELEKEVENLKK